MSRKAFKRPKPILAPEPPLKLDFGCGPRPKEGFEGVDRIRFPGVAHVLDIAQGDWSWPDNSVGEFHASHFLEHLTGRERVFFFNELYRVLQPGGTGQIITPHWSSCRAYGDWTHQWPPVSEFLWYYLDRNWRLANAPHTDVEHTPEGHSCDFVITWSYNLRPDLGTRNLEYQQFAVANHKEVCQDMIAHLTARK